MKKFNVMLTLFGLFADVTDVLFGPSKFEAANDSEERMQA